MRSDHHRRTIYLDHHATTPLDPRVLAAMMPMLTTEFGNPSSGHTLGRRAGQALRAARGTVRAALAADHESEIVFTSGATEANTLAIVGAVPEVPRPDTDQVVTTAVEHHSVRSACDRLAARGYTLTVVGVDRFGLIDPEDIAAAVNDRTALVSVMYANNEIGTVQPIPAIAAAVARHHAVLHVDAVQAATTLPIDVHTLGADLLSVSGHKIYGPKGVGVLYVRRGIALRPEYAGAQEFGLRAGTHNMAGIAGMAEALRIAGTECADTAARCGVLRDRLQEALFTSIRDARVNGHPHSRLRGNLSLTIPGLDAVDLIRALPEVAISAGSACATGSAEPSPVLMAIGLSRAEARATIRIGVGRGTTEDDIDIAAERVITAVDRCRRRPQ
ncbi:cysteine desulfurase family protein [Actinoplanes sp. NBRC 101535]|uniref:cysteine desulfurase family protein n=1 Tax=Actinoplanes sp. NBRC 101535 TaxID=3032196 RepID=UPI0024A524C1|nr:cysteine desulfurase family protein [Actinoplanes sp. NBRC 101535]GLY02158.1 cysteine desulfurase NifS [Actinoplanes sp. NBRC 101535]